MLALDKREDVILILLDLSAAFDTIDHDMLLARLRTRFGITGNALKWIESYLCGRTQRVCVGSMVSEEKPLDYGVPQGSIAGPMLFSLYVYPPEDIIAHHKCQCMIYADDTQINVTCKNEEDACVNIEKCIADIRSWMSSNFLALNDAKTEFIYFVSKFKNQSDQS